MSNNSEQQNTYFPDQPVVVVEKKKLPILLCIFLPIVIGAAMFFMGFFLKVVFRLMGIANEGFMAFVSITLPILIIIFGIPGMFIFNTLKK